MSPVPIHAGVRPELPMSLDAATAVLALGLGVFLLVAYDIYRSRWTEGSGWL